jgi:sodium-dependent dicarboxylate transporter 2/3/5
MKTTGLLLAGPAVFIACGSLLPALVGCTPAAAWAVASVLWMLVWWIAEVLPIAVTSLLPILLLPATGVLPMDAVTTAYGSPYVYLFLGGFLIAIALEKWEVHRRVAFAILSQTGTSGRNIVLGFMLATAFLSMWISNTATALMMLPIALSISAHMPSQRATMEPALLLATAYAASIGGVATLVGTPPNVAMAAILSESFGIEVSFFGWMVIALPFAVVLLMLVYGVLTRWIFSISGEEDPIAREHIHEIGRGLGPWKTPELRVVGVFVGTALLWISGGFIRSATGFPVQDTWVAILGAAVLFVLSEGGQEGKRLLDWEDAKQLPWDILLLFGGGLAAAEALSTTGVLEGIATYFATNSAMPWWGFGLVLVIVTLFLTEIMSNLALAVVLVPIVAELAPGLGLHPLTLAVPVALGSSCAFMLPMATPPNAIVFGSGRVRMGQMVRAGFLLNIAACILAYLLMVFVLEPGASTWIDTHGNLAD